MTWLRRKPRPGSGLLAGRSGWLFWVGTERQNIQLWHDNRKMRRRLSDWERLVAVREAACRARGIRFVQVAMPDKLSIHHDRLVDPVIDPDLSFGRRLGQALSAAGLGHAWIDLFDPFRAESRRAELHMRTDTHFTPAGYTLAYRTVCRVLEAEPAPDILALRTTREPRSTDLGLKLVPPEDEICDRHHFHRDAVRGEVNALARFREAQDGHVVGVSVGSVAVLHNARPGIDPRRVVVFGDSFSFDADGLGAMLAESFAEVHLLWSARIDWDYVDRVRPAIVLNEIAEFFMGPVPVDGVSIERLAAERLARVLARPEPAEPEA